MNRPSSPSWYDLLGLEPSASESEIRAAWRAGIANLEPTDRRFRAYNQAAEVLLDQERRATYDATLAEPAVRPPPAPDQGPQPLSTPGSSSSSAAGAATSVVTSLRRERKPRRTRPQSPHDTRKVVPVWLLVGLAVLTIAVASAAGWVSTRPSDATVAESTQAAQSTAERAIIPILSYDHRSLEEDQEAAHAYMTADYRKDYDQLFEVLKDNAPRTETVVEAEVVASGIVRSGEDRVEVLLFVNRPTTNKQQKEPVIYKDHVRVQLENVEGEWLVDCLITSPGATCD